MDTGYIVKNQKGSALLLSLFFSVLFFIMFGATLSYILMQYKTLKLEIWETQAMNIAEAGAHYYRWHLAHSPTDYSSDTDLRSYKDPQGGIFGYYDVDVTAPEAGSTIAIITVKAYPTESPTSFQRIRVRYGRPSLAHFAFLTNSNVWFGEDEEISGEMHSNGGVRMDGEGDSLLTSAKETYICGPEHGCNNMEKPGIWGTGADPIFWEYPVGATDFNAIVLDLNEIKTAAESDGVALGSSNAYGYFLQFQNDGKFDVYKVTKVYPAVKGYNGTDWVTEANDKESWAAVSGKQDLSIPENGLIFVGDNLWVSGQVKGRATVVAARLPTGQYTPADIYIQDDITYANKDGSNVLALIAQQDLLVPLRSDNVLEIDAALVAVNGHVFRYYYEKTAKDPYKTYAQRDKIETYGTIITNTIWTWSWVDENEIFVSGYRNTETTYDPNLTYNPPPSFPTEDEYRFILWEELPKFE